LFAGFDYAKEKGSFTYGNAQWLFGLLIAKR
jgi:hypothetical protein